jgi:DNA-binding LytR/AlgR family response regulator
MPEHARHSHATGVPAWRIPAGVVAAYSVAALLVAGVTHSATARPWPDAARDLWSAAMIWAVLTGCIALLVRRWPVSRLGYGRAVLVYGVVILGASWVVNGVFLAIYVATGAASPDDLSDRLHTASVLNLPFNAVAAAALVAGFHWRRSARNARLAEGTRVATAKADVPEVLPACSGNRRFSVPVASIECIEAADDYAVLHCAAGSYLCSERLHRLEEMLAQADFLRVHRSTLVNLRRVVALSGSSNGVLKLELSSGRHVGVSRRRQARTRKAIANAAAAGVDQGMPR